MASHNVYTFFLPSNCLDEEFDAPDVVADRDLCRGIMAGRMGLHPDVWGDHDPLSTLPPRIRSWQREPYERVYHPSPADRKAAKHWPRPVVEVPKPPRRKPGPRPSYPYTPQWQPTIGWTQPPPQGTLQLTCDVCERARFMRFVHYRGDRLTKIAEIRELGHQHGWTCIAGTDRCPECSQAAAPKPVGNGTGGNQGDEQHA